MQTKHKSSGCTLGGGRATYDKVIVSIDIADRRQEAQLSVSRLRNSEIVEAVPAISIIPDSLEAGGFAYSFDLKELNHRAAGDVDAILRGPNPGEIPF